MVSIPLWIEDVIFAFSYCCCVLERFSLCWLTSDNENFFFSEEEESLKHSSTRGLYCCCKHTLPLNLCKLNLICQVFKINLDSLTIPCGMHKLKSLWAKLLKNASGFVFTAGTCKKRCADTNAFCFKVSTPTSPWGATEHHQSHGASPWQGLSHPQMWQHSPNTNLPWSSGRDNDTKATFPSPSAGCLTASVWKKYFWKAFVFSVVVDTSPPLNVWTQHHNPPPFNRFMESQNH